MTILRSILEQMLKAMKVLHTLVLISAISMSAAASAQISGRIVNATRDSSGVSAVTVRLQKMTSGSQMPVEVEETTTNSRGNFRFKVQGDDQTATFFAAVDFQGVRYFSEGAQLAEGSENDLTLVVYDSTHSADNVEAFMHHIIVDDFGDVLQFRETRVLNNSSNKTITEAIVEEHIGKALFRFRLPKGATNFTPLSSRTNDEIVQHGQYAIDRGIFTPGNKTISFGYEIAMPGQNIPLTFSTTHPTKAFDFFVSSENIVIDAPQLTDHGPFDIRGKRYFRYGSPNLQSGAKIELVIRRVGKPPRELSSTLPIGLTAALLLLGLSIAFLRKEKPTIGTTSNELRQQKKALIEKIAQLDLSESDDTKTQAKRHSLMLELQNIELQLSARRKSRKKI
jgi:hypothetical protein